MNQEHNRHIDFDQVARYLAKEMNEQERTAFETDIKNYPELKAEFEQIASIWTEAPQTDTFNTDAAWSKLSTRIQANEETSSSTAAKTSSSTSLKSILRMAASLIIVAVAGWYASTLFTGDVSKVVAMNEPLTQELPDNSIAELNTGTTLEYDESFGDSERRVKLQGEAFFKVTHNPEKPFIVATDLGNVQVLGTEFNVKQTQKGEFEITVQSGKVQISLPDGSAKDTLVKGQSAILDIVNKRFNVSYHTANLYWLTKSIKFKNIEFEAFLEVLENTFQVRFDVQDECLNELEISSTLQKNQSLDEFLKRIEEGEEGFSDIEFIQKEGSVYEVRGKGC